jgi:hypothetical protein
MKNPDHPIVNIQEITHNGRKYRRGPQLDKLGSNFKMTKDHRFVRSRNFNYFSFSQEECQGYPYKVAKIEDPEDFTQKPIHTTYRFVDNQDNSMYRNSYKPTDFCLLIPCANFKKKEVKNIQII